MPVVAREPEDDPTQRAERPTREAASRLVWIVTNNMVIALEKQIQANGSSDDALKAAFETVRNKHPDEKLHPLILIVEAFRHIAKREENASNIIEWYPSVALNQKAIACQRPTELLALIGELTRYIRMMDKILEILAQRPYEDQPKATFFIAKLSPNPTLAALIRDYHGNLNGNTVTLSGFEKYIDTRLKQLLHQSEDIERANPHAFAAAFGANTEPRKQSHWCAFHGKETQHTTEECLARKAAEAQAGNGNRTQGQNGQQRNGQQRRQNGGKGRNKEKRPNTKTSNQNVQLMATLASPDVSAYYCPTAPSEHTKYIFDTGAAIVSYLPDLRGFDQRTVRKLDPPVTVNGIDGQGYATAVGVAYLRLADDPNDDSNSVALRFDAAVLDVLGGKNIGLISLGSISYDGGFKVLRPHLPKQSQKKGLPKEGPPFPHGLLLQAGVVCGTSDESVDVSLRLPYDSSTHLFSVPAERPLTQAEIEKLVPDAIEPRTYEAFGN